MAACETKETADRLTQTEALLKSIHDDLTQQRLPQYHARRTVERFAPVARGETGGFKSFGHFMRSVRECGTERPEGHPEMGRYIKSMNDKYSKNAPSGMNETIGADGGFLIPPEFLSQILMRTYANDLLSRTTLLPISGNMLRVPAINETSRANGSRFGGIQSFWRAEGASVNFSKPALDLITLQLEPLTILMRLTDELIQDAGAAVETYADLVASSEIEFKVGDALINGTGVNMPQGISKSGSLVVVAKDSAQVAATLTTSNLVNMWSRLHVSCMPGAVWLVDQSVYPQLFQLTIGNYPVYMPPGGLSASPYGMILGKPVLPIEFGKQLGTQGDIYLADLSTILSISKMGTQSAVSMHVFFQTSEQCFRFTLRLDARSWWKLPLTPFSGGPTQSNLVTLAVRA